MTRAGVLSRDELILDGNSRLNLATFVRTWMQDETRKRTTETFDKNRIDKDEQPQIAEIASRCVNMPARLWNVPEEGEAIGWQRYSRTRLHHQPSPRAASGNGPTCNETMREARGDAGIPTIMPTASNAP
jgi:hypothetical protein